MDNLLNSSETTMTALEWAVHPDKDEGDVFITDFDTIFRVKTMISAIQECRLTRDVRIMKRLFFVMGALLPSVHGEMLFSLAKQDPKGVSAALKELSKGGEAEKISYFNLVETAGRVSRHGLLIDVMENSNVETIQKILNVLDKEEEAL